MTQAREEDTDIATPVAYKPVLNQRFDFGNYVETRRFLDQLAKLSRREDYYPNLSFGKTYVVVSIDAEGRATLDGRVSAFTSEMETLAVASGKV